jgi:pilus assembly protein CpaF
MTTEMLEPPVLAIEVEYAQGVGKQRMELCDRFPVRIGRDSLSNIVLGGLWVGRFHAEIRRGAAGFRLVDLGTLAGTTVNGQRIAEYGPLGPDDLIQIGTWSIRVRPVLEVSAPQTRVDQALVDRAVIRLREAIDLRRKNWQGVTDDVIRAECRELISPLLPEFLSGADELSREQFMERVIADSVGLGPLEALFHDPSITEIMVNRHDQVFIEKNGRCERSAICFSNEESVRAVIDRIVSPLGRRIDESSPMVDARLTDGSRVNAIIRPLAVKGSSLTIRRFAKKSFGADDLIACGSATSPILALLKLSVEHKLNLVVSGGTGSGKTTLLNMLSGWIPAHERIVTIEDAAELRLAHENLVSLEVRQSNSEGRGLVSVRDLLKNALRMRPDRIVVGECRGGETLDMLQAMNTGHEGSLTTIHANTPRDVLSRLEVMVMMAGFELPLAAIREQIASAIDIVVQQQRCLDGRRRIVSVTEVTGVESGVIQTQEIFLWDSKSSRHLTTGIVPNCFERLRHLGVTFDESEILADAGVVV